MDKRAYQKMFLDVDGPIAAQMVDALNAMTVDDFSQQHEVGLLCHRLRGDARTVGFAVIGDLTGIIEDRLRELARSGSLSELGLQELQRSGREVQRRMAAGEAACNAPLAENLSCLVSVEAGGAAREPDHEEGLAASEQSQD